MWSDHAECKDHPEDLWFGFGDGTTKEAKAICNVCPVKEDCLEDALAQPSTSDFGIRGGTSARERIRIRKRRKLILKE